MFYYNKVDLSEGKPLLVLIMRLNFKCPFVMVAMAWKCCILILTIWLISMLRVLTIVAIFMTLANLKQFICWKILCLMILRIYKMQMKDINTKNRVCNCYFGSLIKAKMLETKNSLIDEKNYKDLVIYHTRDVHWKSIKMLSMHYHELLGKIEEHKGKIFDDWWLYVEQSIRQDLNHNRQRQ